MLVIIFWIACTCYKSSIEVLRVKVYLLKVNNRNTRARCEICFTPCSSVSIVNYEHAIAGWAYSRIYDQIQTQKDLSVFVIVKT